MPVGMAGAARTELARLAQLDKAAGISAELLTPARVQVAYVVEAALTRAATAPALAARDHATTLDEEAAVSSPRQRSFTAAPLTETAEQEIKRLELVVGYLTEVNDRVMTQNIAMLHDLEACHKAVRDLRSEKDALAVQLRRRLEASEQQR